MKTTFWAVLLFMMMASALAEALEYPCRPMPEREIKAMIFSRESLSANARVSLFAHIFVSKSSLIEEVDQYLSDPTLELEERAYYETMKREWVKTQALAEKALKNQIKYEMRIQKNLEIASSGYLDKTLCPRVNKDPSDLRKSIQFKGEPN